MTILATKKNAILWKDSTGWRFVRITYPNGEQFDLSASFLTTRDFLEDFSAEDFFD